MLKQRIATALVLATVGLAALFYLPPVTFAIAAALLLAGAGGWEAARLAGLDGPVARLAVALALLSACLALYLLLPAEHTRTVLAIAACLWLVNAAWLARPALAREGGRPAIAVKLIVVAIMMPAAWLSLAWLQASSPWLVVMLLILIAAADTSAYFTGRRLGGPKLAPSISPGKTWSGAIGGLTGAMLLTAVSAWLLPDNPFHPLTGALLGLALGAISIVGDLFVSLLKRQRGIKDTSNLLPGHGGILDRFDSLTAALPFFALAVMLWGH
ncbi:phosphatidate cytidylyltransferase [Wenzhouxiangella sp. AB-CW3]|uniref:phosphatidate cytidylyltransferase n=1 Tax=Wenzhouxiangella sp. AB-CW3 TaxID=2771012 RepID=UPI00168BC76C|nr:phosphatidate cytidylyltransferase [Wenzhouxiangella sp. AB-CW3]QOC23001.1 phosphatidate cytidylyltransferase [Wenzhouxiangella sp. AB-CW3]